MNLNSEKRYKYKLPLKHEYDCYSQRYLYPIEDLLDICRSQYYERGTENFCENYGEFQKTNHFEQQFHLMNLIQSLQQSRRERFIFVTIGYISNETERL